MPIIEWCHQIVHAAGASLVLVRVPEQALPDELALTGAPVQHLLTFVHRAQTVLGWAPADPEERVAESVRRHLAHPPRNEWTDEDTRTDEGALRTA